MSHGIKLAAAFAAALTITAPNTGAADTNQNQQAHNSTVAAQGHMILSGGNIGFEHRDMGSFPSLRECLETAESKGRAASSPALQTTPTLADTVITICEDNDRIVRTTHHNGRVSGAHTYFKP